MTDNLLRAAIVLGVILVVGIVGRMLWLAWCFLEAVPKGEGPGEP